jgi:hypothetical protein
MRLSMHQSYILYLFRETLNQEIYNEKKKLQMIMYGV